MLPEVLEERRVLDGLLHEGYCGAQIKKLDGTVATLCDQGCDLPGAKGCLDSSVCCSGERVRTRVRATHARPSAEVARTVLVGAA